MHKPAVLHCKLKTATSFGLLVLIGLHYNQGISALVVLYFLKVDSSNIRMQNYGGKDFDFDFINTYGSH